MERATNETLRTTSSQDDLVAAARSGRPDPTTADVTEFIRLAVGFS